MALIAYSTSFSIAHAVVTLAGNLLPDDEAEIIVSGFKCGGVSGLHLVFHRGNRAANVVGHHVSDGIVMNIGVTDAYDFMSGQALDGVATRYDYGLNEVYFAAADLVDWLVFGKDPVRRPTA